MLELTLGGVGGDGYGGRACACRQGTDEVLSRVQTRAPAFTARAYACRALATTGRRALLTPPHRARTGTCYNDTGLFGLYFTANMDDKYKTHDLFHHVQEEMVAITTGVSDEDVVRGWAESVGGREGGRGFLGCGV